MENFAVLCPELAFKIEYYADAAAYQDSVGTECGQLCCCTGSRDVLMDLSEDPDLRVCAAARENLFLWECCSPAT